MAIYNDEHDPNEVMWNKQNEKEEGVSQIVINKIPSFTEVWYEGKIEHKGEEHRFWLVHPQGEDSHGHEYAPEVRWFFARVPMEVRALNNSIIEAFKQKL